MANIWLETFLGRAGKYILTFLSRYYYFIIPVVLIYGIFLTLSSYNLKRIEKEVNLEVVKQARNIIEKNPDISYMDLASKIEIPWEEIIKKCSFFPYISGTADLWVAKTGVFDVKKIIAYDDEKIKAVLKRNGISNFSGESSMQKNLYTEYTTRITDREEEK
ncbi:MAG: hypothetical protein PHG41_03755 [Actinomycetota bacterium]|nr:hypothetical protein [Actinomycetota bacterium]